MATPLTPREREVLRLTALGLSDPEIAQRLHLSSRTVETYQVKLREKLKARNRVELTRRVFLDPALTAKE